MASLSGLGKKAGKFINPNQLIKVSVSLLTLQMSRQVMNSTINTMAQSGARLPFWAIKVANLGIDVASYPILNSLVKGVPIVGSIVSPLLGLAATMTVLTQVPSIIRDVIPSIQGTTNGSNGTDETAQENGFLAP
tara:strand:- start:537 stop:941 length:405 start_codon:yes stop_codon:yes gene_type:complete